MSVNIDAKKYGAFLEKNYVKELGRVKKVVGLTMESFGPDVVLDDVCKVTSTDYSVETRAEVIGFKDDYVLLMPYEEIGGIGVGSYVENLGVKFSVRVWRVWLSTFGKLLIVFILRAAYITRTAAPAAAIAWLTGSCAPRNALNRNKPTALRMRIWFRPVL